MGFSNRGILPTDSNRPVIGETSFPRGGFPICGRFESMGTTLAQSSFCLCGLDVAGRFAYNRTVMGSTGGGLTANTRICAVVGHPVRHSASPAMQNAGIAALGLDWRYVALEVRPEDLGAAIEGAGAMGFIGLNLTVPHKLLAFELVDLLDASAREWGAVNTIRFEGCDAGGAWRPLAEFKTESPREVRSHGFNTDADAIVQSLKENLGLELRGARVLVLGAGGAGRVAALRLARAGVRELFLVNRTRYRKRRRWRRRSDKGSREWRCRWGIQPAGWIWC